MAGAAALIASLAVPVVGLAADPAPQAAPVQLVGERTSGETTVILVQQTPKKPWETPAWAYPERGLTFFPEGPGKGQGRWAVGGLWQIAPMFTASYRHGLGSGFAVDAALQTIIMYNSLGVGVQWGTMVGPFSLGLTGRVDGFFGTMGKVFLSTQFNSTGWGVLVKPGAKAGLQVTSDTWLTLAFESYLSVYQATNLGGLVISPDAAMWQGFGFTLVAEYSPKKEGVIYYGVSLYKTRSNYPLWFNVDFSPRQIVYLGLLAGYEF